MTQSAVIVGDHMESSLKGAICQGFFICYSSLYYIFTSDELKLVKELLNLTCMTQGLEGGGLDPESRTNIS